MTGQPGASFGDLLAAASAARANAYAPFSNFPVGAALRAAQRPRPRRLQRRERRLSRRASAPRRAPSAPWSAAGDREIVEAVVIGGGPDLCSPCGGCRQRLAEFAAPETPIHLCGPEGLRRTVTLGELLPLAFSGRNLGAGAPAPEA